MYFLYCELDISLKLFWVIRFQMKIILTKNIILQMVPNKLCMYSINLLIQKFHLHHSYRFPLKLFNPFYRSIPSISSFNPFLPIPPSNRYQCGDVIAANQ